jgi:hypothetical protein
LYLPFNGASRASSRSKKKCVMSLFAKVEEHHIEKEDDMCDSEPANKDHRCSSRVVPLQ